jgi:hypothetical protein
MLRKLVKTAEIEIDDQTYRVVFYELKTVRGMRRFSSEVVLGPYDRIIIDDDSLTGLESRVARLVPATIYSRQLASRLLEGRPPVAA